MKKNSRKRKTRRKPAFAGRAGSEILAEEFTLQPWFLPKRITHAVLSLLPADYRYRMRDVFLDWGCMRCDRKGVPYGSNGMCVACKHLVYYRVTSTMKRQRKLKSRPTYGEDFMAYARLTQKLLKGHRARAPKSQQTPRRSAGLTTPAIHAVDRFGSQTGM